MLSLGSDPLSMHPGYGSGYDIGALPRLGERATPPTHPHQDEKGSMCMFAHDDTRLIGALWPGINAMDGPVVRVTGNGDASLNSSIGRIADREFERLWDDERTLYITVVDGEPQYTELPEMAWSVEGQYFASVLEDIKRATREGGELGRRRTLSAIKSDPERVRVAVLELRGALPKSREFSEKAREPEIGTRCEISWTCWTGRANRTRQTVFSSRRAPRGSAWPATT
jgi:hypothetical protein